MRLRFEYWRLGYLRFDISSYFNSFIFSGVSSPHEDNDTKMDLKNNNNKKDLISNRANTYTLMDEILKCHIK